MAIKQFSFFRMTTDRRTLTASYGDRRLYDRFIFAKNFG
jgi:hypothetical protein